MDKAKLSRITHHKAINDIITKFQFKYGNTLKKDLPEDDPLVQKVKKLIADGEYTREDFNERKQNLSKMVKQLTLDGHNLFEIMDKAGLSSKQVKDIQADQSISCRSQFRYHFQSNIITKPDVYITTRDTIHIIFGTLNKNKIAKMGYTSKPVDKQNPIIWADIPDNAIYVLKSTGQIYQKEGYFDYENTAIDDDLLNRIRIEA